MATEKSCVGCEAKTRKMVVAMRVVKRSPYDLVALKLMESLLKLFIRK